MFGMRCIILIQMMLASWLQQFDTLQQYLRSLFDCECVSVQRLSAASEPVVQDTVRLLTSYGKKIMELSEQATYQYRNQHYLARKQVEQELAAAHRAITGEDPLHSSYEQMIRAINERLQDERKSIYNRLSMPESRVVVEARRESRVVEESGLKEEKEEERNVRASKGKSRVSKNGAVRQALQVKTYLEGEEDAIREFFGKLGKMLETHKVPIGNLEQEALKFTRASEENSSDRISDLVRTSTQAHTRNINKLCSLVELLYDGLQVRLKNEGQAEGRLAVFLEEAQRMEEVYSYTLSKMLERLVQAKETLPPDALAVRHLDGLEEITRKLYGLYPSQESMQSLSVRAREGRSYGVQVSLGKAQQERRTNGDAFRLQTRVAECLDRFERNNKHRKTLELKEVDKLIENVREVLPVKQTKGEGENTYQEEVRGLLDLQEKRERQAVEGLTKKLKKAEKRAQELEVGVEELKQQGRVAREEWEQERRKLSKRADSEQGELKKLAKEKAVLDSNLSQYIQDIQRMRQEVRKQGDQQGRLRRALERETGELREECEAVRLRLKTAAEQGKAQRQQMAEERALYRQKIEMTETQLEEERELSAGLRVELEAALGQHRQARAQLSEMSRIYEEKIRELDGVIEHLRQLQQVKLAQETAIQELQASLRRYEQLFQTTEKALREEQDRTRHLLAEKGQLQGEVEHWKAEGGLTDSDLKQLREEVEKVSRAYLESEQQLEGMRREVGAAGEEREKLVRERLRLSRLVEDLEAQNGALKVKQQATELSERDLRDEYYQTAQESKRLQREIDEARKETGRVRKELQEEREQRTRVERELRELRQDQQGRKQVENVEQGRRRMELENLRMELRRKTEQAEKQQAAYEQKLSMAQQKMKEMEEFAGQKHLLSRLMHNHQTQ